MYIYIYIYATTLGLCGQNDGNTTKSIETRRNRRNSVKCDGNVWKHVEMHGKYEDTDGHTNILHMYTYIYNIYIYIYIERERERETKLYLS